MTSYESTCLIGAEFTELDLRGADFSNCDLSYARFVNCDLYGAQFDGTMLYHCTFLDCELTKASFVNAYLSGFRLRGVDLTHAEFDKKPIVGDVRKPLKISGPTDRLYETRGWLTVDRGEPVPTVSTTESEYTGIYCTQFHSAIVFSSDPETERWRSSRRREEVCKILRTQLQANGYSDKALNFYFEERRFRRKALPPTPFRWWRRLIDILFGELFWGYSTRPLRPVAAYVLLLLATATIFLVLPELAPGSGLRPTSTGLRPAAVFNVVQGLPALWQVIYFLATCEFGVAGLEPVGILGQVLFAAYCLTALAILTLMFAAIARRLGQN